ncbi:WxL domain-containing protein [Enterococcus sp. 669A]|uniref:WxL domain-containing protein n=1 Tax=Candidatus Enterococcus moelleringii TaxID=2815325 RepID=A0ABS3LBW7_9ENTE|nr:WxL domain-containing protein [Enterococcus sp. 669A]MBO1307127.1 WxL domain-containing protein [Enterococcus sp. 669A]
MRKKLRMLVCVLLVSIPLFPTSPVIAETIQDVPVGETTIPSKVEDPLKEYQDNAQSQVSTDSSTSNISQDVPESTTGSVAPASDLENESDGLSIDSVAAIEEQSKITNQSIETMGGVMPMAGTVLTEGSLGDSTPYDIDKNLANALRTYYGAPTQITDDFMESLTNLSVPSRNLNSIKGIEYAKNLKKFDCSRNQIAEIDVSVLPELTELTCSSTLLSSLDLSENHKLTVLDCNDSQITNLYLSANSNLTSLKCRGNKIVNLDLSTSPKLEILDCYFNQITNLDLSANQNLTSLNCNRNQLSSLDLSSSPKLLSIDCSNNQISNLDLSANQDLTGLSCMGNQLSSLNLSSSPKLLSLSCSYNNLNNLDLSANQNLVTLTCGVNPFNNLDLSANVKLQKLDCSYSSQLSSLDLTANIELTDLNCDFSGQLSSLDVTGLTKLRILSARVCSSLTSLDVSTNTALRELYCQEGFKLSVLNVIGATELQILDCGNNKITSLDVHNMNKLVQLNCRGNNITNLNLSGAIALEQLTANGNQLSNLDVSTNINLSYLFCDNNLLPVLDISENTNLIWLNCSSNSLTSLDVSANTNLWVLECSYNHLKDITSANNLTKLDRLEAEHQLISIPVPPISDSGEAVVDILRTTAHQGLFASMVPGIVPTPTLSYDGDKILLSNVTYESLDNQEINFKYNGSQLVEGATSGTKKFDGKIKFFTVSVLDNELKPINNYKFNSGKEVEWQWYITNRTTKKAENVEAKLNLPSGLTIVPGSIKVWKNGALAPTINDLEITNTIGDLDHKDTIAITFKTTAIGDPDEWLEATGDLNWEDDTITSPYANQSKGAVQILDDEQTFTPKDYDNMAITSVPIYLNYGVKSQSNTAQTYSLEDIDYQTNTNVKTKGFYTRLRDDRPTSTGWKLTAKLSDFSNQEGIMPYSQGAKIRMQNLSMERVNDRDTPQETVDVSPTGPDVPAVNNTDVSLEVGQTETTLVTAQANQGMDTWQLRMPFDKISLNLPPNAGKKGRVYKAKLTWSLNDTP